MLGLHFYNLLIFTVVFLIDFKVKCCKLQIGTNTVFVIQFVKNTNVFYMKCMCHPSSEHVGQSRGFTQGLFCLACVFVQFYFTLKSFSS